MDFEYQFDPRDTAVPRFYMRAVQNNFESEKQGRAIFVDIEWVDIRNPGDPKTVYSNKVTDVERKRFPNQYSAFKNGLADPIVGTPLRQWPMMTPATVEEFTTRGFLSVEHLAHMKDSDMLPGDRAWQVKAQAFLKLAAGSADIQRLESDLARKDMEISALKEEIARLSKVYELKSQGIEVPNDGSKRIRKPKAVA